MLTFPLTLTLTLTLACLHLLRHDNQDIEANIHALHWPLRQSLVVTRILSFLLPGAIPRPFWFAANRTFSSALHKAHLRVASTDHPVYSDTIH